MKLINVQQLVKMEIHMPNTEEMIQQIILMLGIKMHEPNKKLIQQIILMLEMKIHMPNKELIQQIILMLGLFVQIFGHLF